MARKLTVVVSQGQSANPAKRKLEEDLVAGLLFERLGSVVAMRLMAIEDMMVMLVLGILWWRNNDKPA